MCKFDDCRFYTFYTDDKLCLFRNCIVVTFHSKGSLSPPAQWWHNCHCCHFSGSECSMMGGLLVNNSLSQVFN